MSGHGGEEKKGLKLPLLKALEEVTEAIGSAAGIFLPAPVLIAIFVFLVIGVLFISPVQTKLNFEMFFYALPLWVPLLLGRFAVLAYVKSKRFENHASQKTVLLEILLPKDTMKSPAAMEGVFNGLYLGGGEGTWWAKYVLGKTRPWLSFEMAAFNGQVRFYVWLPEAFRRGIEQRLYSQYPNIEIIETEDYSRLRDPSTSAFSTFAVEYLAKKGNQAIPIKTYVDYGVNETTIMNEYSDPLNQVFKFMSGLEKNEELWMQFIIRTSKSEKYHAEKNSKGKPKTWKDDVQKALDRIQGQGTGTTIVRSELDKINITTARKAIETFMDKDRTRSFTPSQINAINLIERNKDKLGFDVGVRMIYSTPTEKSAESLAGFVSGIFNAFDKKSDGGGTVHGGVAKFSGFPWEDTQGKRRKKEEHEMVELYRARVFFHPPYRGDWAILTSEELATLYHFPAQTKTVQTAPPNLPR